MYSVRLLPQAQALFARADRPLAKKLARCFEQLEQNPHYHPNIRPLSGSLKDYYRFRVGDHRVVYSIDERERVVVVTIIAHRRKAYD